MIPSDAAAVTAAAALHKVSDLDPDTPGLIIAKQIASGGALSSEQVEKIRDFFDKPPESSASFVLAESLYGGRSMRHQVSQYTGQPDPGTMTTIAAVLPEDAAILAGAGTIPLVSIGHSQALTAGEVDALTAAVSGSVESAEQAEATARWCKKHETVWHSPALHALQAHLTKACEASGVPVLDEPWMPTTTPVSASVVATAGYTTLIDRVQVSHNGATTEYKLPMTGQQKTVDVTPGEELAAGISQLSLRYAAQATTIVNVCYQAALSRVGRMATREHPALREYSPAEATRHVPEATHRKINTPKLIEPALDDVTRHLTKLTTQYLSDTYGLTLRALGAAGPHPDSHTNQANQRIRASLEKQLLKPKPVLSPKPGVIRRYINESTTGAKHDRPFTDTEQGRIPAGLHTAAQSFITLIGAQPAIYETTRTLELPVGKAYSFEPAVFNSSESSHVHDPDRMSFGSCDCALV